MCRYCFVVHQHADFGGLWLGWRLRGRDLISPEGDRVNPRRLAGLLWVEQQRRRVGLRPNSVKRFCVGDRPDHHQHQRHRDARRDPQ